MQRHKDFLLPVALATGAGHGTLSIMVPFNMHLI